MPMPWDALDEALIRRMAEVVAMKRKYPVLQRGARLPIHADSDTVLMARQDATDLAMVAVNAETRPRVIEFRWPLAGGRPFDAVMIGAPEATDDTGSYRWTLPPLTTAVALLSRSD